MRLWIQKEHIANKNQPESGWKDDINPKMELTNLGTWLEAHRLECSEDIFHLMIEEPDVLT